MKPFDDILDEWFDDYGGRVPVDEHKGMEAMCNLTSTLLKEGYSRSEAKAFLPYVVGRCTHNHSKNPKSWKRGQADKYRRAVARTYRDQQTSDTVQGTSYEHLEKAEIEPADVYDPKEQEDVLDKYEDAKEDRYEKKPYERRILSEDILNREKLDIEYDTEIRRMLGFEDE